MKPESKKIETKKFRIGTLAEKLNVEKYIVRFWEKEFDLKAHRSTGQQRFYTKKDLEKFSIIKELLYEKGFTISGAKKHLKEHGIRRATTQLLAHESDAIVASQVTTMENTTLTAESFHLAPELTLQMLELQKKLIKLRELL